jgi:hypothetical protein
MPYLRRWWERYKDKPFLIIGVHTPEFGFEKNPENVKRAISDLQIEWPVVLDNDYINWNNFANHYWPAKYLISSDGDIVFSHFGEGNYAETESAIQALVRHRIGDKGYAEIPIVYDELEPGAVCFRPTPELYCGYARGNLSNDGGYWYDIVFEYRKPEVISRDSVALAGEFLATPEYVQSAGPDSTLYLDFHATEVNVVLSALDGLTKLEVKLNGKPIPDEIKGADLSNSELIIKEPRMYRALKSDKLIQGTLSVKVIEGRFQAFAFTFSGCEGQGQ